MCPHEIIRPRKYIVSVRTMQRLTRSVRRIGRRLSNPRRFHTAKPH